MEHGLFLGRPLAQRGTAAGLHIEIIVWLIDEDVDLKIKLLEAAEAAGVTDVIGGEMEGNGVYLTCKEENIPCMVIKGICDWGVSKNTWEDIPTGSDIDNDTIKDSIQAMATTNAFATLKFLLSYDSQLVETHEAPRDLRKKEIAGRLKNALDRLAMRIAVRQMLPYLLVLLVCVPCVVVSPAFSYWISKESYGYIPIALLFLPLSSLLSKLLRMLQCQCRCDFVVFRRKGRVGKWRLKVYSF